MEVAEDELMMIVWEGYLKKKTPRGVVKVWQNRYFRLLGDVLEYYKSDKLGVCSGMIPLQMMSDIHLHPSSKKGGCRFDIVLDWIGSTTTSGGASLSVSNHRRVFSLLAPTQEVCEKLVRSIRNMLHHPVDENARMDITNIDMSGNFWKKIDEIERRRAGSSKKVDVAAQFAGFDIKPKRKKKPLETLPEQQSQGQISPPTTSRVERERLQTEAPVQEVETPVIRILKELDDPAHGKLYLARDNDTKVGYYMHVMNRMDDPNAFAISVNDSDTVAPERLLFNEMKDLWIDMMKLNHPFLLKYVSNGESIDRLWVLYNHPVHTSLDYHLHALVKQQQDGLAFGILRRPNRAPPLPTPMTQRDSLIPIQTIQFIAIELIMLCDYIHSKGLIAYSLDTRHIHLNDVGHITLVDFFLAEMKEGKDTRRREKQDEKIWTPERHRSELEDLLSDSWRIGLILYQLMTGILPPGITRPFQTMIDEEDEQEEDDGENHSHQRMSPHPLRNKRPTQPDPLTPSQRIKMNILSFDSADSTHLPFPSDVPPAMMDFVQLCLTPQVKSRLGASTAPNMSGSSNTNAALSSSSSSNTAPAQPRPSSSSLSTSKHTVWSQAMQGHDWLNQTDWKMIRAQIKDAQLGVSPLPHAPDYVLSSLLFAPHDAPYFRSLLHAHRSHTYQIVVNVHAGRHFTKSSAEESVDSMIHTTRIENVKPAPKFYIKVLVDGKALKTDVGANGKTGEWRWEKTMKFKADDASLGTDLIARVMAQDQDSFHDATIGSVTIPLRHVYQMCECHDRSEQAGPSSSPAGFSAWFSVVDRDGFVVGELRLTFEVTLNDGCPGANAPVVSRRRFSFLFGSRYSSQVVKEDGDALPVEQTQREIEQVQLIQAEEEEDEHHDDQKKKNDDELHQRDNAEEEKENLSDPHVRMIARRASNITLKSSLGASGVHNMARLGTLMKSAQASADDPDDDDDDEDEEKLPDSAPGLLSPPSGVGVGGVSGRKSSPSVAERGSIVKKQPAGQSSSGVSAPNAGVSSPVQAPQGTGGAVGFLRGLVSKKKFRFQEKGFDLDLSYIGDRIIAMGFPSEGSEAAYRNPMIQVQLFFKTFHPGSYKVYNLCSERKYDHMKFQMCENGHVAEYPFDDHNCPQFSQIIDLCVDVHAWLTKRAENVAAIHCKAGKGRTGLMIACYLLFSGTCTTPESALTYFATHRTSNGKGVTIPSQLRYVHYFHRYLTHYFDLNRPFPFSGVPLLLTHLRITGLPKFDLVSGGCDPFFNIFQSNRCVFDYQHFKLTQGGSGSRSGTTGGLISSNSNNSMIETTTNLLDRRSKEIQQDHIDFKVFVWLKADCKLLLYERDRLGRSNKIAWFWFHTSMLYEQNRSYWCLTKSELDGAIKDKESKHFPTHFKMELWFKSPPSEYLSPIVQPPSLVSLATEVAKINHRRREDEAAEAAEEDEDITPRPLQLPFDASAAARADAICHEQAMRDFDEWQAEQEEACMLFQPEAPPA